MFFLHDFFFIAKAENSTFHGLEFYKNTRLIYVIASNNNVDAWQTLLLWS